MSKKEKIRNSKFLKNKKSFIFITTLCMGIGFAFLSSNLTITGNASVSGNSWEIYFQNIQVSHGSVSAPIPTITNDTTIDFTVEFTKPGDYYEFTVDVMNTGTINAEIESI